MCRHKSIPAASPADVSTSPSSTNKHVLVDAAPADAAAAGRRRTSSAWSRPGARRAVPPRRGRTRRCRSTPAGCRAGSDASAAATLRGQHAVARAPAGTACPGSTTVSAVASASGPACGHACRTRSSPRRVPASARTSPRRRAGCRRRRSRYRTASARSRRRNPRRVAAAGRRRGARRQFGMFLTNGVIHATSRGLAGSATVVGDADRRADDRSWPRSHWAWVVAAVSFIAILGAAGFRSVPGVMMTPPAPRVRLVARAWSGWRCRST